MPDRRVRRSVAGGLVLPLLTGLALAGCGGDEPGDQRSAADPALQEQALQPTDPEFAAPSQPGTTAESSTPPTPTPRDRPRKKGSDDEPSPTPPPTARPGVADGSDPTPTNVPPQTLAPPSPTDPWDRAYARQMFSHQSAGSLLSQNAESRGGTEQLRAIAHGMRFRQDNALTFVQRWGDLVGMEPATAFDPEHRLPDMRLLGAGRDTMRASERILKSEQAPFSGRTGDAFDDAIVDALIANCETGLELASGPIQTKGSARFRKYAQQMADNFTTDLDRLRELRRDG